MLVAMIVCAAKFTNIYIFDINEYLAHLQKEVLIGVILETIVLAGLIMFGIFLYFKGVEYDFNCPICCYTLLMFFLVFIPMLFQGATIQALDDISET